MGVAYKAVQWNRQKIIYDLILLTTVVAYLFVFGAVAKQFSGGLEEPNGLWIRAYGSAAFILLHVILSIGPLARLNPKFLPLLYNRRHMGVTMFCLAFIHGIGLDLTWIPMQIRDALKWIPWKWKLTTVLTWYHDFGNVEPWVSLLSSNTHYESFIRFPFQILGLVALLILFLMAATSHDFWLANLTAPIWKGLHMLVYVAYGLLVGHVVLGPLETNTNPFLSLAVAVGFVWLVSIHLIAGLREVKRDGQTFPTGADGFVDVGTITDIPEQRAKIVPIAGERVAIFKYEGKISAVSNVCQHQNGPLGEGKIVNGCITCPWHGYEYRPESGESPPPFTEKIPTFNVKLQGDRILVYATPNPAGTTVPPAIIGEELTP